MKLADLDTPALVLDRTKLAGNLARMSARAGDLGVALRPHLKTAKSADIARLAVAGRTGAITVSTLAEAEYFADHGFDDMIYAVGIVAPKLERVAALRRKGIRIAVITDSVEGTGMLAARAGELECDFEVMIEIDTGGGRGGITASDPVLLGIAEIIGASERLRLDGVLSHAGQSYHCASVADIAAVAEEERAGVVTAANRLRQAGHPCPVVSVGSTPTAIHASHLDGVTEMRPGVYMFGDLYQVAIGSCRPEDLALSVLASVIGHKKQAGTLLIDAGAIALSQDRSMDETNPKSGFGGVRDFLGDEIVPDLNVAAVNQEHGFVSSASGAAIPWDRLPLGARVRVHPNHACMTAAQFDCYHVVDGDDEVIAVWPRCRGW